MSKNPLILPSKTNPAISHESTGLPVVAVPSIGWWTCEAMIVRDENVGREPCEGRNVSWEDTCKECGATRNK